GTLFENMQLLFGPMAANWKIVVFEDYSFLFAILPPGAFVGMGLLIALKNIVDGHLKARAERNKVDEPKPTVDRRVRVTG
ncbi:electron transport complex subunit RsxE, partial [Oceanospirillum sp. HFRX-1_2]